ALAPLLAPRAGHGRGRWLVRAADILAAAGRAHEARDRYDEAARELRGGAARRPSAAVLTDLSRALLGLGRLDEAELEARRALAASPSVERTDLLTAITRARAIESARPAQGGAR
ncbi:MAG: hypothetical protein K1X94_33500, partial [Sandaracinaceae bacterium]|nr:hypothetical protein [Sandaracinaceae bacterium]